MTHRDIEVTCELHCVVSAMATIPNGKIKSSYVKWDTLYLTMEDGSEHDIDLHSDFMEAIDTKRPISVEAYEYDEDGHVDYGKEVEL